uniref:Uncharacterized protein n=1 Tax=Hyaloperonospora arabidopsidis (strain Emoy2) TaxID=559515 RepID=M4BH90_HYAAE
MIFLSLSQGSTTCYAETESFYFSPIKFEFLKIFRTTQKTSCRNRMDVSERLVARRTHLALLCHVDPVKQQLRLQSYYQLARQLYRQSETYFAEGAWDNALCSKVITAHHDYKLPRYSKESEWVRKQAVAGFKLFDAILDGMEAEELEYLEYERSLTTEKVEEKDVPLATEEAAMTALKDHLQAMRLEKKGPYQPKVQAAGAAEKEDVTSASIMSQLDSLLGPSRKERSSTVLYPTVGKASWMTADAVQHPSCLAPPLSRQRSQEAIANLTSGKIRTLEIPAGVISQFISIAAPNTNKPPYGIETCGILAGILVNCLVRDLVQHSVANCYLLFSVIRNWLLLHLLSRNKKCVGAKPRIRSRTAFCRRLMFTLSVAFSRFCLRYIRSACRADCAFHEPLTITLLTNFLRPSLLLLHRAIRTRTGYANDMRIFCLSVGVFRLTEPNGLQLIQNCSLTGFHTHPSRIEIYSDAFECQWMKQMTAQLVDMR